MDLKRHMGALATILSAIIFGFTPILARLAFDGGGNGITITFLRSVLAIPVLYIVVKKNNIPLKLTRKEFGNVVLFGVLGVTITTIALSVSYEYIPVGISTTLHFIYPILVTTAGVLLFHDRVTKVKIIALFLGIVGVLLFLEKGANIGLKGVLLALFSGFTYTFYMLGIEKTNLRNIHYFKLAFYFCIVTGVTTGIFGMAIGELNLHLTKEAWFYSFLISIFVSVGAISLFQIGIKKVGASTAAILSTLEPITSIILGTLFLQELLTVPKIIGCVLIILSVILMTTMQEKGNVDSTDVIKKVDGSLYKNE